MASEIRPRDSTGRPDALQTKRSWARHAKRHLVRRGGSPASFRRGGTGPAEKGKRNHRGCKNYDDEKKNEVALDNVRWYVKMSPSVEVRPNNEESVMRHTSSPQPLFASAATPVAKRCVATIAHPRNGFGASSGIDGGYAGSGKSVVCSLMAVSPAMCQVNQDTTIEDRYART